MGAAVTALFMASLAAGMGNVFAASSARLGFLAAEAAVLFRQIAIRSLTARTAPSALLVVTLERPPRYAALVGAAVEVKHVEALRTRPQPVIGEDRLTADHAFVRLSLQLLRQTI